MRSVVFVAAVAVIAGATKPAEADQCQGVTKKQAEAAKAQLSTGMKAYAKFCGPCGDAKPQVGTAVNIEVKKSGKSYDVVVDGTSIDLAYVYTPSDGKANEATNLALRAGCKAVGVPERIDLGTAQWWLVIPKSTDRFVRVDGKTAGIDVAALAGTWNVSMLTELSTCSNDVGGTKAAYTWTASAAAGQLKIRSNSGGAFTGQVDSGSQSLIVWNDANRATSMTQLVVQDAKTLTGRQVQGMLTGNKAEPVCAVYRTVTAVKAN
jgi:hypothetical protein